MCGRGYWPSSRLSACRPCLLCQSQAKVFILALSKVVSIDALCIYSGFTVFIGGRAIHILILPEGLLFWGDWGLMIFFLSSMGVMIFFFHQIEGS